MEQNVEREPRKHLKVKPYLNDDIRLGLTKTLFEGTQVEVQSVVSLVKRKNLGDGEELSIQCVFAQQGATLEERIEVLLQIIGQFHNSMEDTGREENNEGNGDSGGDSKDNRVAKNEVGSSETATEGNKGASRESVYRAAMMAIRIILLHLSISPALTAQILKLTCNGVMKTKELQPLNLELKLECLLAVMDVLAKDTNNHEQILKCGILDIFPLCKHQLEYSLIAVLEQLQPIPTQLATHFAKECITKSKENSYMRDSWVRLLANTIKDSRHTLLLEPGFTDSIVQVVKDTKCSSEALLALFAEQGGKLLAAVVRAGIRVEDFSEELKAAVSDFLLLYAETIMNVRDQNSPWFIPTNLLPSTSTAQRKFTLVPVQERDISLVETIYKHQPIPGYEVKSVQILHNEHLSILFSGRVNLLEERHSSRVFQPWWSKSGSEKEKQLRTQVMDSFYALSRSYARAPHVSFLPLWYSSHPSNIEQLRTTGFANLLSLESGKFGKGFYLSTDAEYALKKFGTTMLVAWVAAFSPFPVIQQDNNFLMGKANHENYDVHFAPALPDSLYHHAQLVVFESSQILPHYLVELQPTTAINQTSPSPDFLTSKEPPQIGSIAVAEKSVDEWSTTEVNTWMSSLALSQQYKDAVAKHHINGRVLSTMKKKDWIKVGVKSTEDVDELLAGAAKLQ